MDNHNLLQRMEAGELASNTGSIIKALAITGLDYQYTRMRALQTALAATIDRSAMCSAIDYLADSGYILARTVEDHAPASVSDVMLEDLEIKLSPKGKRLQMGVERDPLVKM